MLLNGDYLNSAELNGDAGVSASSSIASSQAQSGDGHAGSSVGPSAFVAVLPLPQGAATLLAPEYATLAAGDYLATLPAQPVMAEV